MGIGDIENIRRDECNDIYRASLDGINTSARRRALRTDGAAVAAVRIAIYYKYHLSAKAIASPAYIKHRAHDFAAREPIIFHLGNVPSRQSCVLKGARSLEARNAPPTEAGR